MIINGRDAARFYASHSREQIHTIIQTLEAFGFHRELELFLKGGIYKKKFKREPRDTIEEMLRDLDRQCPQCHQWRLRGTKIQGCEHKESGRTWYEECAACRYYREEFGGKDAATLRR